ncbi:hypoxanthine phosphoribosyltransferase [Halodesulfovibrio sp.]|jgi:hypoxanthine phosphoribosyltransferase|uniref:hypoxanthine phosphoribosyltransferase n=1 Tax=Halodesulfovibrio sp. TaxID=1912772 RepID=UPI0025E3FA78|nr:hypoxanthine phosphoribosyltransferase [Halodesulfovibrio sp.]MCT4534920.1 hypoxanthine phosphoribosyltransferase [Halodesulfovibrio sp.]MCT4627767.1 hypoxanthine phosphoribosyltransferase [Halodesulfovibrio sp.]
MEIKELKVVYSEEQIQERVKELAAQINKDFEGEDLVVVCVLKGAFMFFSDLLKHLTVKPEIDFVRCASYGNNTTSSKTVSFTKDLEISIEGKHVLIVEDIVDTGHTITFLMSQLKARGAKSLKLASVVEKLERRETEVVVDYPGFILEKGFIVGYGMDYAEKYRELGAIYEATVID